MPVTVSQTLDLTAHHDRYAAIDPRGALKGSAVGKVVFLSGASRGIGQATAVAFAEAGAKAIYLLARSEGALEETRAKVLAENPEVSCALSACDVTKAEEVAAAVGDCVARFGAIDVADANAGVLAPFTKFAETDPEVWWRSWEINLRGAYHVARFTLSHLIESAARFRAQGGSGGHLVFVSSVGAQLLMEGASDYQTSKHAINRLCEFVQSDHGADGVTCFAMHPGGVATELGLEMPEGMHEWLNDTPDLAACFKVWLASGQADWAAGRYLSANWDVDELVAMKDEIIEDELLVNRLRGR